MADQGLGTAPAPGLSIVPLRPLTTGELLDAAVGLLRANAAALLGVAAVLAIGEQAVLYPMRSAAGFLTSGSLDLDDLYSVTDPALCWLSIGVGFGLEATAIALLGGLSSRAAAAAVNGWRVPPRGLLSPRASRLPAVVAVAAVCGLLSGLAALTCLLPWVVVFGLLGSAVPVVVVDGHGAARGLGRSVALSSRLVFRGAALRLVGYVAWFAIRVGLGLGGTAALSFLLPETAGWKRGVAVAVWAGVNTVAYACLACVDAVLHLETRMRTEGLDIVAVRARGQGQPVPLRVVAR